MIKIDTSRDNVRAIKSLMRHPRATRRGIRKAFYHTGQLLVKTARENIRRPGRTGRTYKVYVSQGGTKLKRPRLHRASARGENPANLSGVLQRSTDFFVHGTTSMFFGSKAKYAPFLEENLDRPFLKRAIDQSERDTERYFNIHINRELTR